MFLGGVHGVKRPPTRVRARVRETGTAPSCTPRRLSLYVRGSFSLDSRARPRRAAAPSSRSPARSVSIRALHGTEHHAASCDGHWRRAELQARAASGRTQPSTNQRRPTARRRARRSRLSATLTEVFDTRAICWSGIVAPRAARTRSSAWPRQGPHLSQWRRACGAAHAPAPRPSSPAGHLWRG